MRTATASGSAFQTKPGMRKTCDSLTSRDPRRDPERDHDARQREPGEYSREPSRLRSPSVGPPRDEDRGRRVDREQVDPQPGARQHDDGEAGPGRTGAPSARPDPPRPHRVDQAQREHGAPGQEAHERVQEELRHAPWHRHAEIPGEPVPQTTASPKLWGPADRKGASQIRVTAAKMASPAGLQSRASPGRPCSVKSQVPAASRGSSPAGP